MAANTNNPRSERNDPRFSKDISSVLSGWDYEPGTINVRKIHGRDGAPKLQMRLDLGLLQMEVTGRPDGRRPHGCESLLEYFQGQLEEHARANGTELGFHLTRSQCQSLREEAAMYYQRYLSLFVLEDFDGVVRDTARNLRVLDLCGKYAVDEQDRLILEQYRPYILMMNARARASILMRDAKPREALSIVRGALKAIKVFLRKYGQEAAYRHTNEVKVLKRFAREIKSKLPADPLKDAEKRLKKAIESENYEEAARLRDEISRLSGESAK